MSDWARDIALDIVVKNTKTHGYDVTQMGLDFADALRAERAKAQSMREAGNRGRELLELYETYSTDSSLPYPVYLDGTREAIAAWHAAEKGE